MGTGEFKKLVESLNNGEPVRVVVNKEELEKLAQIYNFDGNYFELGLYMLEVAKDRDPDIDLDDEDFDYYRENGEILFVFDPRSEDTSIYWWLDGYYFLTEDPFEGSEWETTPISEINFWAKILENKYIKKEEK